MEVEGTHEFKARVHAALELLDSTGDGAWVRARIARIRPARAGELRDQQAGKLYDALSTVVFDEFAVVGRRAGMASLGDPA
jgi:hypothetical protein